MYEYSNECKSTAKSWVRVHSYKFDKIIFNLIIDFKIIY